jgi:hypothetical protein
LANDFVAQLLQIQADNFTGIGSRKGDPGFARTQVGKGGHEQGLTGQKTLTGPHQFAQKSFVLGGSVPKDGLHLDPWIHEHESPAFGNHRFLGIEFYFDALHFFAVNAVIDFVVGAGHGVVFEDKKDFFEDKTGFGGV